MEFMVNGSRCTIYTAFYATMPVIVKVMRKDVRDKETVRQVRATIGCVLLSLSCTENGSLFCLISL